MGEVDVLRKVLCSISYLCCQETSSSVHRSATRSLKHLTDTSAVQLNSIGMAAEVARSQLNGHQQEGRGQPELSMLSAEPLSRPNKCSTASSLFPSLYGVPTNRAQLRNVRQTKQYMPVIHVLSRACFRETVLHVSAPAKHQHNWLSTSVWWLQLWPDPQFWKASPHALLFLGVSNIWGCCRYFITTLL